MQKQPSPSDVEEYIKNSTPIISPDGGQIFTEAVLLRKVSKFLTGGVEDSLIPIPCFVDNKTGKILTEMLPKSLREEYDKYNETL